MNFRGFLKYQNTSLLEMAMKRSYAKNEMFHQIQSTLEHLVKMFVGQELLSAEENNDWHKQISNFLNRISDIKLKETNKHPDINLIRSIFKEVLEDYREDSRFDSIIKEIKYFHKYNGEVLYKPENENEFWGLIESEFEDILVGLSEGANLFRERYLSILSKIKKLKKVKV